MNIENIKINFLGDSITEGHGTTGDNKKFVSVISEKYGLVCRNYGIGGTRIAKQINEILGISYDSDFCSRAMNMDNDADVIVVFGGTNDYCHGDAPLGEFGDRGSSTFYGALHTLYTSLIEKYPESRIVVLTPLHRTDEDVIYTDNKQQPKTTLKGYVEIIKEVAEYYSLPVLDLFANSGLQPIVPIIKEKYIPDGLHPNDEGHLILAEKIINFLKYSI